MIHLKSAQEIETIQESANILSKTHGMIAKEIKPGVQLKKLNQLAEEFIYDHHARPSFKGYRGYQHALCISVNDQVVHGVPNHYLLKEGDIASVDCGVCYKNFHSDSAYTYPIGEINKDTLKLLRVTKEALSLAIDAFHSKNRIGDVGYVIQNYVEKHHFSVVKTLAGHGIGRRLHEDPDILNYGKQGKGKKIKEGMVVAIEPMVNFGKAKVFEKENGCIYTIDRQPSAHFEHTVAIVKGNPKILTTYQYIEESFNF